MVSLHKTLNLKTRMAIWAEENLIKWWKMWLKIKLTVFSIPAIQWEIIKSAWRNSEKWCLKKTMLHKNELCKFSKKAKFSLETTIWTSLTTWASPLLKCWKGRTNMKSIFQKLVSRKNLALLLTYFLNYEGGKVLKWILKILTKSYN